MNPSTVIPRVQSFEGRVRYMYKCTGGEVTIGFGHAIENPAEAPKLPLTIDGRPANEDEILADYAKVAAVEKGPAAAFFANLTQCRMADPDIDALLIADVTRFEALLAAALPNWSTFPEPAQEALFDMAYNLGISGLKDKFPHMMAAVNAGQWDVAAAECHRTGIGEPRNQATAALFQQAAG
jgi:GH24 family phage-related lysozyme (muramidase)